MQVRHLVLCLSICFPSGGFAASESGERHTVLLRNIALVNPDEPTESQLVSLLLVDGKLDILTADQLDDQTADLVLDARGGAVMGRLILGEPANFIVLDGDPRENVDVLLDTKRYGLFAVHNGAIVRNRLEIPEVVPEEKVPEEKIPEENSTKRVDWLAYTPPPFALPLDYRDSGKFNSFDTRAVSGVFAAALLMDRTSWIDQDDDSILQVGDLEDTDAGEIRAFRLGGVGTINFDRPWVWTLFAAERAFDKGFDSRDSDEFTLFDLRLDIPIWEELSLSVGKQKEPISMERLMPLAYLPLQERSASADGMLPARNVGVVVSGNLFEDRVVFAGGAFNNWLDKGQPNSFGDNAINYVARATWVPFVNDDTGSLLHLGGGYRYSDATEGVRFSAGPEFDQAPDFIDTGLLEAEALNTYQAEASWRSGRLWLHSEWIRSEIDAPDLGDPTAEGYHVTASWVLSGEMREYNDRAGVFEPLPIARTVYQNGWGAWEIAARYSRLDAADELLDAGDMGIWSAGLNWWLTPDFAINFNYRYVTLERDGLEGNSHGINTRLVIALQ